MEGTGFAGEPFVRGDDGGGVGVFDRVDEGDDMVVGGFALVGVDDAEVALVSEGGFAFLELGVEDQDDVEVEGSAEGSKGVDEDIALGLQVAAG